MTRGFTWLKSHAGKIARIENIELIDILGREELAVRVKVAQYQAGQSGKTKTVKKEIQLSGALLELELENVGEYIEKVIEILYQ